MMFQFCVYVGPYAECRTELKEAERQDGVKCPNCGRTDRRSKFCSDCGTQTVPQMVRFNSCTVDIGALYDILDEEHDESLVLPQSLVDDPDEEELHAWLPNCTDIGRTYDRSDELHFEPIPASAIETEKEAFSARYAQEINVFKDFYKSVSVTWGVVTYLT